MSTLPICPTCKKFTTPNPAIAGVSCVGCGFNWGFSLEEIKVVQDSLPKSINQIVALCEREHIHGKVTMDVGTYQKLVNDARYLDFLDAKGGGWIARNSTTGRGYRVHQSDSLGRHATARAAIKDAMHREF